jgi:hypothetical protein
MDTPAAGNATLSTSPHHEGGMQNPQEEPPTGEDRRCSRDSPSRLSAVEAGGKWWKGGKVAALRSAQDAKERRGGGGGGGGGVRREGRPKKVVGCCGGGGGGVTLGNQTPPVAPKVMGLIGEARGCCCCCWR